MILFKITQSKNKIIKRFREPLRDKYIALTFILSLILNIVIWFLLYLNIKPKNEPIFLHYNIYFGIDLIGTWYKVYFIPLSGFFILMVNYCLSVIMYPTKKVLIYLVLGFTFMLQIFLGLASVLIILINT